MNKIPLILTEAAINRVKYLLAKADTDALGVRVSVNKKGCSGYAYKVDYAKAGNEDDIKVETQGVTVFIAPDAALILHGSVMDYVEEDLYQGFKFDNPNAKGTCGCGESFHI